MKYYRGMFLAVLLISILMISSLAGISPLITIAQPVANLTTTSSYSNTTKQNTSVNPNASDIEKKMIDISSSNKPEDIATLAYIWGIPLIVMEDNANYSTNPNTPPGLGVGPWNTMIPGRDLANASFQIPGLAPNADTLYDFGWLNLKIEPLVLKVPSIPDRYYTLQFVDAYGSTYAYVGSRTTGSNGSTHLITGPEWNGQVPDGMTQIKSPTNFAWIQGRILVKGPDDVPNVNAIQDQISLKPLSAFQGQGQGTSKPLSSAASKEIPIKPDPASISKLGLKVYDEISQGMVGNPPSPPDPQLITKFASIGIGPGKTPSTEANDTIKTALQTGIIEGEKLIDSKWSNVGDVVNGWSVNPNLGNYGKDYLLRAAATKFACCANIAQEALYPIAHTDVDGKSLTGTNNYTIHFDPGQTPPVKAFWSITMYNNKSLFVDNPINRYNIGTYTEGLKQNTDGSIDIYVQHITPVKDKESNWLPAPAEIFYLIMRMYVPEEQVLNGTWTYPVVQTTG
jgi:hypothetical protein